MKIIALTKYSYEGPSSRYRFYNYIESFQKSGVNLVIKPLFEKSYFRASNKLLKTYFILEAFLKRLFFVIKTLAFGSNYDLIILEYELFPFLPAWFEQLLVKRGIRYFVDYDDAIFHKYDLHRNSFVRFFLKTKIANVMHYAETVIVGNSYLGEYALKYNKKILKLPTVVLLDKYKLEQKKQLVNTETESPFTIGWIGSKTTSIYILDIIPAIKKFCKEYKATFNLIGFDKSLLTEKITQSCDIKVIEWSETTEVKEIMKFDIGIMPLKEDPWSKGKCGFKLIQYMSCSKPVIASPVGINKDLVKIGENGFLATSNNEWFSSFEILYKDKQLRKKIGQNNLAKIEADYNHLKNSTEYLDLIRKNVTA